MRAKLLASLAAALVLSTAPLAAVLADPNSSAADKMAKSGPEMPTIKTADLKAKLDKHEPVTLIEALEPKHYDKWHLPGAVRMTEPEKYAAKLLPDKKAEIIVYCMNVF
jgi:hypothetical protein